MIDEKEHPEKEKEDAKNLKGKKGGFLRAHKFQVVALILGIGATAYFYYKSKNSSTTSTSTTSTTSDTGTSSGAGGGGWGGGGWGSTSSNVSTSSTSSNVSTSGVNPTGPDTLQTTAPSTSGVNPSAPTTVGGQTYQTPQPQVVAAAASPSTYTVQTASGAVTLPTQPTMVVGGQTVAVPATDLTTPAVMQEVAATNPNSSASTLAYAQANPSVAQAEISNAAKETGTPVTVGGITYANATIAAENNAKAPATKATTTSTKKK